MVPNCYKYKFNMQNTVYQIYEALVLSFYIPNRYFFGKPNAIVGLVKFKTVVVHLQSLYFKYLRFAMSAPYFLGGSQLLAQMHILPTSSFDAQT